MNSVEKVGVYLSRDGDIIDEEMILQILHQDQGSLTQMQKVQGPKLIKRSARFAEFDPGDLDIPILLARIHNAIHVPHIAALGFSEEEVVETPLDFVLKMRDEGLAGAEASNRRLFDRINSGPAAAAKI